MSPINCTGYNQNPNLLEQLFPELPLQSCVRLFHTTLLNLPTVKTRYLALITINNIVLTVTQKPMKSIKYLPTAEDNIFLMGSRR